MKNTIIKIRRDQMSQHPYHEKIYGTVSSDFLEESIKRTGNVSVYPIVVVPVPDHPGLYWVVSGMKRLLIMTELGNVEIYVMVRDVTDEDEIKQLIIDLNKNWNKDGHEHLMEFRHYMEVFPEKRGVPGNRYSKIGKDIGRPKDSVKDLVILNKFFEGEGEKILEAIFGGGLAIKNGFEIKKVVERFPEKFTSESSFEKVCNILFDYSRLEYGTTYLNLEDPIEYDLFQSYLLRVINTQEFQKKLEQMGKIEKRIDNHEKNKVSVPILNDVYNTENTCLIKGNNRDVEFKHPFEKEIQCIVGSCEYGNRRLNGDDIKSSPGHNMNGQEYGKYLAETYERYKPYMSKDGSIYVIIDDYRLDNGAFACSLEHFVSEMEEKGFFLVGRYTWIKDNPMPRSYADKDMVNGFEMVYRFSLVPKEYYCNPDLFIELVKGKNEGFREGCTNTDGKGKTTRGSSYYQSHLKKLRNTLDERNCNDIIRGNVCNPEDFFRQSGEKKHTSQSPIYLTSTFILESTRPDDLVVDIWNGVGNTMDSALLLGRKYVGIELENDYFQQSCRRADATERVIRLNDNEGLSQAA